MQASHLITRGILLVVGRVTERVYEVLGVLGGSSLVKGGLLDPYFAPFAPLKVLYGTIFGSKHHIMGQLAHVNKVGITGPFPDLWSPPGGPQSAII